MNKHNLPIALGIKMRMKKMNCGGPVKMAEGGMVDEPAVQMESAFNHKDLAHAVMKKLSGSEALQEEDSFLTADEQTPLPNVGMPDDTDERMNAMPHDAEDDSHKGMLHEIMAKIHRKHKS